MEERTSRGRRVMEHHLAEVAAAFSVELQTFSQALLLGKVSGHAQRLADGPMIVGNKLFSTIGREYLATLGEMLLVMGRLDQDTTHGWERERAEDEQRARQAARREHLGVASDRTLALVEGD